MSFKMRKKISHHRSISELIANMGKFSFVGIGGKYFCIFVCCSCFFEVTNCDDLLSTLPLKRHCLERLVEILENRWVLRFSYYISVSVDFLNIFNATDFYKFYTWPLNSAKTLNLCINTQIQIQNLKTFLFNVSLIRPKNIKIF